MIIFILSVLGLILGSFVNATVWRLHEQETLKERAEKRSGKLTKKQQAELAALSISKGRSMCSKCHHELAPKDLVPLFSWLYLRGRCRYCHQKIEDNPLIEALLPVLFVISYLAWPLAFRGYGLMSFILWLVFLTGFMALAAYDLRWYLLPNKIVFPLIGLAVLQVVLHVTVYGSSVPGGGAHAVIGAAVSALLISGLFWILFQVSDGTWIGGGDVKLAVVLGLLAAWPADGLLLIFLASLLGTLVALPLLATGRADRTSRLPFGPYLLATTFIVVLWGDAIIRAYNRLFLG